jgi:predicted unusual protein kinase regulating ubiquinone biosynthesis (AarF/ABC1/UbiB family)
LQSECSTYKEKILTSILEVEDKLIEETNYLLELKQSQEVAACKDRKLSFPEYYPEYSSEKLSHGWMTGCIYLNLKF